MVSDHALGFLAAGYSINRPGSNGPTVIHALAQADQIDVFHSHGLYPIGPEHFDHYQFSEANNTVLANALKAKVTVCISEFSANLLRHKLHIDPVVTRNGIWTRDYSRAGNSSGPVLFPKSNLDANAHGKEAIELHYRGEDVISIAQIKGIRSTGPLDRSTFLNVLRECSIYLGTTKENNSMASMEAMITGVPVVGYRTGFNAEWLISGNGCELVEPGDIAGLHSAVRQVRADWNRYSKQAREYAGIFDWQPVIDELLELYGKVGQTVEKKTVSIVIPVHNYGKFLAEAIDSALAQTVPADEVIVVDDQSTDDSMQVARRYGDRIKIIQNYKNVGVAETRNTGIRNASGTFIVCLDADDYLLPSFVQEHLRAFATRDIGIAFAPIDKIDGAGNSMHSKMFRVEANPGLHANGMNQIPSCCMFRKEFWARAGGYDSQYSPAEDAQLWLKMFSLGAVPKMVSKKPLMHYRQHGNSLSSSGRFPDWYNTYQVRYTAPIAERDPRITVVIDQFEGAQKTLWSLEQQQYKNWSCQMKAANSELKETFPWLNRLANSLSGSVIHIRAGTVLSPLFLTDYIAKNAAPLWTREPRFQLP